jgi:hypothetical protein
MDVTRILSDIDAEISRLQQARAALSAINGGTVARNATNAAVAPKRRGRPKGSTNVVKTVTVKAAAKPAKAAKRKLSPEGRKRIQEAMKRRWAERRKETKK